MATNCCRLCLSTEDGVMEDIFSDNEMPQKIFDCFSIEVKETSELPTKICEVCKSVLIIWWKFKRQCLEANDKLQDSFPHLFNPYKIEVLEDEVSLSDQEDQVELYSVVDNESDNEIKEEEEKELVIEYNECEDEGHIQEAEDSQSNIDGMEFALEYEDAKPQEFDKIEEDKEESSGKGTQVLLYETITEGGEDFKLKTSKGNNLKLLGMVNKKDNNLQVFKFQDGDRVKYHTVCQVCGKLQQNLRQHMLVHTNEKPLKCHFCGRGFRQHSNLKHHLNIHTGEKPYSCEMCEKSFADPASLRSHMVGHTGERKYRCETCGKSYGHSHTLAAHRRIHTQERRHTCSFCQKKFLSSHALKKHVRTHTGERPYQCDQCPKSFTSSGNLTTHKRVHTKERPYKCTLCPQDFGYGALLKYHMKTHENVSDNDIEKL